MIAPETLNFLTDLAANNNREWFTANRSRFDAAQDNLTAFAGYLIGEIGRFDAEVATLDPKSCVFRIYRDVRFSKDKSPYKTNIGAYISPGGRKSSLPGYYFHLQPGASFVAGGKHMPDGTETLKIRNAIANNTDEFLKIVQKKNFRDAFGDMRGDRLKNPPKGFEPDHPAAEYLKLKGFVAYAELHDDQTVTSADFPKNVASLCKQMYPLVTFLRNALAG